MVHTKRYSYRVNYKRDYKAVIGAYIEISIDTEVTNKHVERRQSYIYLSPPENRQGSIKYFVIDIGAVVVGCIFDVLPQPDAIIKKEEPLGKMWETCYI